MESLHLVGNLTLLLAQKGLPITLTLAFAGFACASVFGCIIGIIRFFKIPFVSQVLRIYVDSMRGLPFLMILFFLFYVMPFFGMRMSAMTTAVLSLTLHTGAYISEIIRGALISIPTVQHEASKALAMTIIDLLWADAKPARDILSTFKPAMDKTQYLGWLKQTEKKMSID